MLFRYHTYSIKEATKSPLGEIQAEKHIFSPFFTTHTAISLILAVRVVIIMWGLMRVANV